MPTMETMAFTHNKSLFDKLKKMDSYAPMSAKARMAYNADIKAYPDMI